MNEKTLQRATESELFDVLQGAVVPLFSQSPDKKTKYRTLFSIHESAQGQGEGVDINFIDAGKFNIPPANTAEREGSYELHTEEKLARARQAVTQHDASIRAKLRSGSIQHEDTVNIVAMTEDSGWEVDFNHLDDPTIKQLFLDSIKSQLKARIREQDNWIYNHVDDATSPENNSFPGPNLKPFQEHLEGGFKELMDIIYNAADAAGLDELRYQSHVNIGFGWDDKAFFKEFIAHGTLLDRDTFERTRDTLPYGKSLDSNYIHIPDGQDIEVPKTLAELGDERFVAHSEHVPFDYSRRMVTEWLQDGIGTKVHREQGERADVNIAYISASVFEQGEASQTQDVLRVLNDDNYHFVNVPSMDVLRQYPNEKIVNGADMLILRPEPMQDIQGFTFDPNLFTAYNMIVNVLVDPQSMTTPIILDNRSSDFDNMLEILRDGFTSGRFIGEFPVMVANTDEQLQAIVSEQAAILESSKFITKEVIKLVPNDKVLNVFVAGGHNNNSKRDLEEAHDLGYMLAQQNMRIVTGGGQIDGSMGAVHTGFIQYHLDQLQKPENAATLVLQMPELKDTLQDYMQQGRYNAEALITQQPDMLEQLANLHFIPRDMFYAYSTQALIEMESPNNQVPPAVTYQDTVNRVLRLDALKSADAVAVMPGGYGTDEEVLDMFRSEIIPRLQAVSAGEMVDDYHKKLIIYNRNGQIDGFLRALHLVDEQMEPKEALLELINVDIVNTQLEVTNHIIDFQQSGRWEGRLQQPMRQDIPLAV